jgi:hypothetical protein
LEDKEDHHTRYGSDDDTGLQRAEVDGVRVAGLDVEHASGSVNLLPSVRKTSGAMNSFQDARNANNATVTTPGTTPRSSTRNSAPVGPQPSISADPSSSTGRASNELRSAAQHLLAAIDGEPRHGTHQLPCGLVIRDSSRASLTG